MTSLVAPVLRWGRSSCKMVGIEIECRRTNQSSFCCAYILGDRSRRLYPSVLFSPLSRRSDGCGDSDRAQGGRCAEAGAGGGVFGNKKLSFVFRGTGVASMVFFVMFALVCERWRRRYVLTMRPDHDDDSASDCPSPFVARRTTSRLALHTRPADRYTQKAGDDEATARELLLWLLSFMISTIQSCAPLVPALRSTRRTNYIVTSNPRGL
jgi:hypothetical protein